MTEKSAAHTLEVLGQKLHVRSDSDPEIVGEAVRIAMLKIKDAEKRVPRAAPYQVALVALLDLAEDYARAKRRATEHRRRLDEQVTDALSTLEEEPRA
ncbi:MAG: cell division protein ZapA [Bdellovibrionales bacterium]|nr:cell division protein ZapA [Bdellovibrionales bacterium]